MTRHGRLLLLAVTAALALALAAGAASAFEQTLVSQGKITFGTAPAVRCDVTLQTTFVDWQELPIEGRRAGAVTGATIRNCEGGSISAVLGLPWEMASLQILGTLPDLTGILVTITNFSVNFSVFGGFVNCLFAGSLGLLIEIFELGGGANDFGLAVPLEEMQLPFIRGSSLCPTAITVSGAFATGPLAELIII